MPAEASCPFDPLRQDGGWQRQPGIGTGGRTGKKELTDMTSGFSDGRATGLRRLLREPLLHFIGLAALVFLAYAMLAPALPPAEDQIVVTRQDADRLRAQYRSTWNRAPSEQEFRDLVDQFVRDEVYYREARAYGLDLDDQVVRVRMRQKMEFLLADPAAVAVPSEAELLALFEATKQKYVTPESIAFRQVFLGEPAAGGAEAALAALTEGADPANVGLPSLLPGEMALSRPASVDSTFGDGFFAGLVTLPMDRWAGPVRSAYGQHLVRVTAIEAADAPEFEAVRASVEAEWLRIATRKLAEARYADLKGRYQIDLSQTGLGE